MPNIRHMFARLLFGNPKPTKQVTRELTSQILCADYPWVEQLRQWVVNRGGSIDIWGFEYDDGTIKVEYSINGPAEMISRITRAAAIAGNAQIETVKADNVSAFEEWANGR